MGVPSVLVGIHHFWRKKKRKTYINPGSTLVGTRMLPEGLCWNFMSSKGVPFGAFHGVVWGRVNQLSLICVLKGSLGCLLHRIHGIRWKSCLILHLKITPHNGAFLVWRYKGPNVFRFFGAPTCMSRPTPPERLKPSLSLSALTSHGHLE